MLYMYVVCFCIGMGERWLSGVDMGVFFGFDVFGRLCCVVCGV